MRTQSLKNLPHDLETRVVIQRALRCHSCRHCHGKNDVPEVLALRAAHHAAHRLDDVYL